MQEAKPTWVRETLCEDLANLDRSSGRMPDTKVIETIIDSDLRRFSARQSEGKIVAPSTVKPSEQRKAQLAKSAGTEGDTAKVPSGEVYRGPIREAPKEKFTPVAASVCQCKGVGTCKTCKLHFRIRLCCVFRPGTAAARKMDFLYPRWGNRVIDHYSWRERRVGPYKDLSELDRDRVYVRSLQDIADASTGQLGPWWVK